MIIHAVFNRPLDAVLLENQQKILFGMGCFWGVERCFWQLDGVVSTAVGYAGGQTENPDYHQVCTGTTGHTEVVEVIYDSKVISTIDLLKVFWERHDPTQGMRQGNDRGSQYRSMIVCYTKEQKQLAMETSDIYQQYLNDDGYKTISTEILSEQVFYMAEEEHQQYLYKNPQGYCGLSGTGTCF